MDKHNIIVDDGAVTWMTTVDELAAALVKHGYTVTSRQDGSTDRRPRWRLPTTPRTSRYARTAGPGRNHRQRAGQHGPIRLGAGPSTDGRPPPRIVSGILRRSRLMADRHDQGTKPHRGPPSSDSMHRPLSEVHQHRRGDQPAARTDRGRAAARCAFAERIAASPWAGLRRRRPSAGRSSTRRDEMEAAVWLASVAEGRYVPHLIRLTAQNGFPRRIPRQGRYRDTDGSSTALRFRPQPGHKRFDERSHTRSASACS